jgi:hypothetical protein
MIVAAPESNIEQDYSIGNTTWLALETEMFKDTMDTSPFKNRGDFIKANTKGTNQEWLMVKGHGHVNMTDLAAIDPLSVQLNASCGCLPMTGKELAA